MPYEFTAKGQAVLEDVKSFMSFRIQHRPTLSREAEKGNSEAGP